MAMALVPLVAGPASAAPPANDEAGGAIAINFGDTANQDTTEATTNAGDQALNENCGAPFTNASVWYTFTPTADQLVLIDTSQSSYEAGLMVFRGTPTVDSLRSCGPVALGLNAKAGRTYTIMVFSDTEENGGSLALSVTKAPPAPRVHVSIAKRGVAFHGGAARIHGSYRCAHAEDFGFVDALLKQRAGRLKITGEAGVGVRCNGKRHHWTAKVVSPVGTYARGKAVAKVKIFACGLLQCRSAKAERDVHLVWAKAHGRTSLPPTNRMVAPKAAYGFHRHLG
jgi:hypothetical protein